MKNTASRTELVRVWVASVLFFAAFYALLVPLPALLEARGQSDGQIGLVLGMFGVTALLARPFAGVVADTCGYPRVMRVGALVLLLGTASVVLVASPALLLVLRTLQALGYVAFTTAATAQVSAWTVPERRSGVLAWYGTAANVAMTLAPALVTLLLPRLTLVGAVWLAAGFALVAFILVLGVSGASHVRPPDLSRTPWRALLSVPPAVRVPMLLAALIGCSFAAYSQYLPLLATRNGAGSAAWGFAAYGVSITLTRIVVGRWLDQGRTRPWLLGGTLLSVLALGVLALAHSPGVLVVGAALLAMGAGILTPIVLGLHADALSTGQQGRAVAWYYLGLDGGLGLGSWGLALVLSQVGIQGVYLAAGAVVALGLLLIPHTLNRPSWA